MSDFIRKHLITSTKQMITQKQDSINFNGFFHFDGVKSRNAIINRVNRENPFMKEEILSSSWHLLEGSALIDIYNKIKNNEFYFYKTVNGKDHRLTFKNVIK